MTAVEPLAELTAEAVECRTCGHGYPSHDPGGGHCRGRMIGWGAVERDPPCPCPHFRWIDPAPDAPVDYGTPPSPAYG